MNESSGQKTVHARLKQALMDLPPMPGVVMKLLQVCDDPSTNARSIEKLVATDQALAAKILKVVNSPFYALVSRVGNLAQAVTIMGYKQLRNIALSMAAISALRAQSTRAREFQHASWTHGYYSAALATLIAKKKNLEPTERDTVFTGGLLHDIGMLFFYSVVPAEYEAILKATHEPGASLLALERETFNIDHAEMGMQLARIWNFPAELILLIGRHEGPYAGDPVPTLYCVHAADKLAHVDSGSQGGWIPEPMSPLVWEWLDFDEEALNWLARETEARFKDTSNLIGLP